MPDPLDGTAGSIVDPIDPEAPEEADVADPGKVTEAKQAQRENEEGKYGAAPVEAHTAAQSDDDEQPTSWIEIELVDEEDQPVAGEKYEITLPDESVSRGTLDQNGFARVEGIEAGSCKVTFPELDKDAWEKA